MKLFLLHARRAARRAFTPHPFVCALSMLCLLGPPVRAQTAELYVLWRPADPGPLALGCGGPVGYDGAYVHFHFHEPPNTMTATITQITVHEVAAHTSDLQLGGGSFNNIRFPDICSGCASPSLRFVQSSAWGTFPHHNGPHQITASGTYTTMV